MVSKAKELPKHPPKNPETCVALGDVFAKEGAENPSGSTLQETKYEQARKAYEQALEIDAGCVSAYRALGQLYAQMGDHENAVKWYHKGLDKHPKEGSLWLALGMCHARAKEWNPAVEALRRATECEPSNRQYQNMLGSCLVRAGYADDAFAAFCKGGSKAQAHYHMAFMLHHMKQDAEARQHLQAATEAEPNFEPARRLLAQLDGRQPADPAVTPAGFDVPVGSVTLPR